MMTESALSKSSSIDLTPVIVPEVRATLPEVPGCEVVRELGRGGMGVVYLGRQIGFNRFVAAKFVRASRFDEAGAIRFRREITAAAALNHPGIVQVYDCGQTADGAYYLLEYCPGGSLADRLRSGPLSPSDAARLVARIAEAVQAAHDAGILHRDLKPANILFAADGSPKVADFGLARWIADDSERLTDTGAIVGTPGYMAPDQAVDRDRPPGPSLDIYSLGAILYASLAGRPPFVGANSVEVVMQACAIDPLPPEILRPGLPADLNTICLKCLEIDPARRYATAAALAADLNRWLSGEPIVARPNRPLERLWKWAKRKPTAAALVGVSGLTAVLVAGLAVGGISWAADAERRRVIESDLRADAERQRDIAREQRRRARLAVDQMLDDDALVWLASQPRMTPSQKQFLQRAAAYYSDFVADAATDSERAILQARTDLKLSRIHQMLNDAAAAEQFARQAVARFPESAIAEPPAARRELARAWNQLSLLTRQAGRAGEAQQQRGRAVELMRSVVRDRGEPDDRTEMAKYLGNWAIAAANGPTPEIARPAFEEAIRECEQAQLANPNDSRPSVVLANNLCGLALLERLQRRPAPAAVPLYRRAIEAVSGVIAHDPDQIDPSDLLGRARTQLSMVLAELGDGEGSAAELRAAAELYTRMTAEYPGVSRFAVSRANVCNALGDRESHGDNHSAAITWYTQAIFSLEPFVRADPNDRRTTELLANAYYGRGDVHEYQKQYAESLADFERALPLHPGPRRELIRSRRATILARLDRRDELIAELAELARPSDDSSLMWQCALAAAVGAADHEPTAAAGVVCLRRFWQLRPLAYVEQILHGPDFAGWFHRADFQNLLWEVAGAGS